MGRFWSLLFLLVPVLGVACFLWAPHINMWLPEDISAAGEGDRIDGLFKAILALTGIVFIATELTLFWFMWKYDGVKHSEPVKFVHGNHALEIVWTIIPAGVLLFIAIFQMDAWADETMHEPESDLHIQVTARQFEWRFRYPGPDGLLRTQDDIQMVNDLHIPANRSVVVELESMDVLHSFFLPNLRVKQDAVPGMKIPVWFNATKEGTYDLVCAELCGWGHYKMKGRLTVLSGPEFEKWLEARRAWQESETGETP